MAGCHVLQASPSLEGWQEIMELGVTDHFPKKNKMLFALFVILFSLSRSLSLSLYDKR